MGVGCRRTGRVAQGSGDLCGFRELHITEGGARQAAENLWLSAKFHRKSLSGSRAAEKPGASEEPGASASASWAGLTGKGKSSLPWTARFPFASAKAFSPLSPAPA